MKLRDAESSARNIPEAQVLAVTPTPDWRSEPEKWAANATAKEFAEHELTIMRDDGLYRHLRCQRPKSWMYGFDIVTWPGSLVVQGDIGTFAFKRVTDMFEFFENSRREINPGYWAEKAVAFDRHGGPRDTTLESFERRVREWIASEAGDDHWGLCPSDLMSFRCAVERDVIKPIHDWGGGDLAEARQNLIQFEWKSPSTGERRDGRGSWEWDFSEFDTTFLRCCHAIVLGIKLYREATA